MGNATTKDDSRSISIGTGSRKTRWDGPASPGRPILISGTNDAQPDIVAIRWERSPSNGGSAIVGYLVEHRRLGSSHWVRSTPGLCAFPELTLSGLEPGWRYQFRVRAQNALGLSRPSDVSEPLTVTLQRTVAVCAPRFDLELEDTMLALENEQAEFAVRFSGMPLPKISWFKDGFEIFSSRRTRIVTDNGKSVLLIHQTVLNDEGEIKCTATNRAGHVATRTKLILQAPPRIRLPRQYEDGLLFERDETVRLKVSLVGRPSPMVDWYHDGEPISKDVRHIFETMDGESVLRIPDAKRNDRGEYTVKAVNKLGEDTASFLVTVTDRPAAPGKVIVAMTLGRTVTLSWNEPEDDGGCKIGTYIVEYYRTGWEVWLKATTSRRATATLTELIEGSEYKFRVKAENPYGVSDPSEESDVVFVPDLKRRTPTTFLSEKSQSHREINRSRGDKREVNFTMPAQRTRSLTREEAKARDDKNDNHFGYDDLSISAQRLASSDRPSKADSRVTFALDKDLENTQSPIPPARSREHPRADLSIVVSETKDEDTLPRGKTALSPIALVSPMVEANQSLFSTRERRSLSPISIPAIDLHRREDNRHTITGHLLPEAMPREDDEDALRGSSEFILVLYPENETGEKEDAIETANVTGSKQSVAEEDENDLVPPPMSLSLPELFSAQHRVVEIMREAVSSTELLHERAMERFYRALAAEEALEIAKRKTRLERLTGELAAGEAAAPLEAALSDIEKVRPAVPLRRRLSNSGVTTQNLIASWQAKKNRRRSSEGQTDATRAKATLLLSPALLPDVEARSNPNLPSEMAMATGEDPWGRSSDYDEPVERLRRWHEANVSLLEESERQKSIQTTSDNEQHAMAVSTGGLLMNGANPPQPIVTKADAREEKENSNGVETSEEEASSGDSEDLKLLKSRILARWIMDEEDTYHPRGRPVPHVEPEAYDRIIVPASSPPPQSAVSSNNVIPKSILKKPKEESIPRDSFGRPIPPEKPIRKVPLQQREDAEKEREEAISDLVPENIPDVLKTSAMSESDTDSIVSAAEAAKNRRIQSKLRSVTSEEEEAAEMEARMAVVNQYTELVREYSSHSNFRAHDSAASSRRSSVSDDQDQKHRIQTMSKPSVKRTGEGRKVKSKSLASTERARKESNDPRDKTPAKRSSRPCSRDQSPIVKRPDLPTERTTAVSSRSSSKTRNRTPSRETTNGSRTSGEKGIEQGARRSKLSSRASSRSSSRSNSRERFQKSTMPIEWKIEKLQKMLESKQAITAKESRGVDANVVEAEEDGRRRDERLALEARKIVRSTVNYITDLTLLIAAMYVYFFKRETLAVPFIALLLYRRIQEEVHGRIPRRWWCWWWSTERQ